MARRLHLRSAPPDGRRAPPDAAGVHAFAGHHEIGVADFPFAVEGSQLEVSFSVDQPLGRFDMQLGADSSQVLAPKAEDPLHYDFRTKLEKTLRLTPVFISQHGLSNLRPPSCQVIVYPDRPPGVTIISPDREISLRPSDQVSVEFAARDDFGVVRAELVAFVGDQPDMKNAVVLPPQSAKGTNPNNASGATGAATETKQANTKDGKAQTSSQQNPIEQKTGKAANEPGSTSAQTDKSAAEPDSKPQAENGSKAPPQTVVIPIPSAPESGEKNVRGKIKLDLRQFHLKQGQQLQYMVRVFDSHMPNRTVNPTAKRPSRQNRKPTDKRPTKNRRATPRVRQAVRHPRRIRQKNHPLTPRPKPASVKALRPLKTRKRPTRPIGSSPLRTIPTATRPNLRPPKARPRSPSKLPPPKRQPLRIKTKAR